MSTTSLKLVALLFMLIDHMGEFIPSVPEWFRWIGRMSAPIFFFCTAWGFYYTHDRKIYLIRMYLCGLGMSVLNNIANNLPREDYSIYIQNDIFVTLFAACSIIAIIDIYLKNPAKGKKYLLIYIFYQIISTAIILAAESIGSNSISTEFYGALFGNIFASEGGVPFVVLGVLLYYTKNRRKKLAFSYCCFCIFYTVFYVTNIAARILIRLEPVLPYLIYKIIWGLVQILGMEVIPVYHIRFFTPASYFWMVIFALPFILLYNGNKGKGYKYFFYIFYPLHIYILFYIGNLIS